MQKGILNEKLAWYGQSPHTEFWDHLWKNHVERALRHPKIPHFLKQVLRGLPPGSRILEAGCGRGNIVKALLMKGFRAEGVDNAPQTVHYLQQKGLPVREMDVRNLSFADNHFDSYLSFGVIEHYYNEQESLRIIQEALRVTVRGGTLFFSVPYTNLLRKKYFKEGPIEEITCENFYQRSYTKPQVITLFQSLPLRLKRFHYLNPVKGIGDEVRTVAWIKKLPWSLAISCIERYSHLLDPYAHMLGVEFINIK